MNDAPTKAMSLVIPDLYKGCTRSIPVGRKSLTSNGDLLILVPSLESYFVTGR